MAEEETRRALNAAHREYNKALVRLSMLIIHVHVADINFISDRSIGVSS